MYSTTYSQITGKRVTQGLNSPAAVAFDPPGNFWAINVDPANLSFAYLSEYSPSGKQINAGLAQETFSYAVPILAIDGVGDIWTSWSYSGQDYIQVFNSTTAYSGSLISEFLTTAPGSTAIAAHGEWVAFGSSTSASWELVGALLGDSQHKDLFGSGEPPFPGVAAMTLDQSSNLYIAVPDGGAGSGVQLVNLPAGAHRSTSLP